ncbi:addiction module antidote protein, HigA family [bacterium]|nr:MAG: addiction module antidote protein, HigA family [bacterium]
MASKKNEYTPAVVFHPGETLAEKLQEMGMGIKEFAIRANKPEKTIHAVINGTSSITPDMAVLFERVTRIPATFWLTRQQSYDEWKARTDLATKAEASVNWAKQFPFAEMVKKGWVQSCSNWEEKAQALFAFFQISDANAWDNIYIKQQLKVAFRISLAYTNESFAISAWLRQGEIQAKTLPDVVYKEADFKETLPVLKKLMAEHPEHFFSELQTICLKAGVKVVYTPTIPKAPINGCTRWLGDTPLIQLSGRYNRNDIFWFTFFHEVGHIILHGKKDVFLESVEYSEKDLQKEEEANQFAEKWTLTKEEFQTIIDRKRLDAVELVQIAKDLVTHPAIIVGRLQREKIIEHHVGKVFFKPVVFE